MKIKCYRFPCEICSNAENKSVVSSIQVFFRANGSVGYARARHLGENKKFYYHQQSVEYINTKLRELSSVDQGQKINGKALDLGSIDSGSNPGGLTKFLPFKHNTDHLFIFKLEEEENTALLLHLPKLFAETAVFGSATGSGCRLVVGFAQAVQINLG